MIARAVALLSLAASATAFADEPDSRAVQAGDEANLVSNAPRSGLTLSLSLGGGLVLGGNAGNVGDTGVGRGPSASFRIGHVATRDTVITFELTGGSRLHESNVTGSPLYHDDDYNLLAGALLYVAPSLWVRGAGGLSVITFDDSTGAKAHAGISGLFGLGLDFVRWRQLVLGIETWGMTSIVTVRGVVFDTGLCLGLTYY
ncbi:MAG TPA: hypothetical protein VH143_07050 [Kofleriaceae bacterium]|nr:hypothetical protein [Kofleriaceae bacterium]